MTNTYGDINGALQVRDITTSVFQNSIIYGSNTNEFQLEFDAGLTPDIDFERILLRTDQSTSDAQFFPDVNSIFRNQDPQFRNITYRDLHLNGNSPALDRASVPLETEALQDLDGVDRIGANSDLGCYEYVP